MKKMNMLLISGHTSGHNKHKNGLRNEGDLNIELLKLVKIRLEKFVNVYVYPIERDAFEDIKNGVFKKYIPAGVKIDYVFEIHFNALNGKYNLDGKKKGTEIFVTTREKGIKVEQAIMRHMDDFFPLRDNDGVFDGVKRTNFLVIKTLKNMGISGALLETCFYDDEDDMKVYNANKGAIADGIVAGMVEGFGLEETSKPSTPQKPVVPQKPSAGEMYRVRKSWKDAGSQIGAYRDLDNAKKACKSGYSVFDSAGKVVYTPAVKPTPPAVSYYKKYTGKSIHVDDVLKDVGVPEQYRGKWSKRKIVAAKNGISNYTGTHSQNSKLISLVKAGKLKRV